MPALCIAKSANVPRLLFAPGEKRAGFYFVTSRVYPIPAFLSSPFLLFSRFPKQVFLQQPPRNGALKAIRQQRRQQQRGGEAREGVPLLPEQLAVIIGGGGYARDDPRPEQPDRQRLMPDIKLHRHR